MSNELENLKNEMRNYKDFFGGGFDVLAINSANSIDELIDVVDTHVGVLNSMESDAQSHLEKFRTKNKLSKYLL